MTPPTAATVSAVLNAARPLTLTVVALTSTLTMVATELGGAVGGPVAVVTQPQAVAGAEVVAVVSTAVEGLGRRCL